MGVTYTTHRDRDHRSSRIGGGAHRGEWLLVAASLVSLLAIALCLTGRLTAFDTTENARATSVVVNLADVTKADALEPALALAFEHPADRRFAARELLAALFVNGERIESANVGGLARLTVPATAIE